MLQNKEKYIIRTTLIIILFLFIVTLLPIFKVGTYNHPFGDDYAFGRITHDALTQGKNIFGAIWETIKIYYNGWQGTYSGVAMMTLTPHIFGEQFYAITPVFMICMLTIGTYLVLNTFLGKKYGIEKEKIIIITAVMLFLSIQFVPDPLQTYYWWNGSVLYTFFHCMCLISLERLIKFDISNSKYKIIIFVELILLAIFIGGGNYVSALLNALICGMYFMYKLIFNRKNVIYYLIISITSITSLLVSILAPGNQVRQAQEAKSTVFEAVYNSIVYAAGDIKRFTTIFLIISIILIIPLIYSIVKKINYSFKYPLICIIFSFFLFAAQNAPHFYAASNEGPARIRNIIYYSYILLIFINEFYIIGWFSKKINITNPKVYNIYVGILPVLLIGIFICSNSYAETTIYKCIESLKSGEVQQYDIEIKQRIEQYENPNIKDVVCNELTVRPKLLIMFDIAPDANGFSNIVIKNYYGKNSVIRKQ